MPSCEKRGWIVAGCNRLQNGDVSKANLIAREIMLDVRRCVPHDRSREYLAGFSGGALRAYDLSRLFWNEFAGIVAFGGWLGEEQAPMVYPERMAVAQVNGNSDKGAKTYIDRDTAILREREIRTKLFTFDGGHGVAPAPVVDAALNWLDEDWLTYRDTHAREQAEWLRETADRAVASGHTKAAIEALLKLSILYPFTAAAEDAAPALEKLAGTADETVLAELAFADVHPRIGEILLYRARECADLDMGKRLLFRELAWRAQPQDFEAASLLARTLCAGDTPAVRRAVTLAEQALALCDAYYPAWETRALAAAKLGHKEEARKYARFALDFVPEGERNAVQRSLGSLLK
jgi:tetratricopeptide (TPR) repeat protein